VAVARRLDRPHIVRYRCESCEATHQRPVTEQSDGMCPACGWPMRIDAVFHDRRRVSVPVAVDRRAA